MNHKKYYIIIALTLFLVSILIPIYTPIINLAQASISSDSSATNTTDEIPPVHNTKSKPLPGGPTLNDPNLTLEQIITGLDIPTSMVFVGPNDILVTEKNTGVVKRIINGQLNPELALDVSVANAKERGLLGIAAAVNSSSAGDASDNNNTNSPPYIFLYYTESKGITDGGDADSEENVLGNRLYRYELIDNRLVNPKLLLDLPAHPPPDRVDYGRDHNGGKLLIGPNDNYVYVGIGNVAVHKGQAQNFVDGEPLDGTSGILRITQDGQAQPNPPLRSTQPMSPYYYAYGIRNTFGMDFDPVTGKLWDTENGPKFGDEINLVEPGFNSGHSKIHGFAKDVTTVDSEDDDIESSSELPTLETNTVTDLVKFGGESQYSDPEFVWTKPLGITALKFLNTDKLGKQYQNTMFIGDVNLGWLYNFKLNPQRTGLLFDNSSPLADKIANTPEEIQETIFGKGFGVITDIQVSPYDGNLYVLTYSGSIYRITSL